MKSSPQAPKFSLFLETAEGSKLFFSHFKIEKNKKTLPQSTIMAVENKPFLVKFETADSIQTYSSKARLQTGAPQKRCYHDDRGMAIFFSMHVFLLYPLFRKKCCNMSGRQQMQLPVLPREMVIFEIRHGYASNAQTLFSYSYICF